MVTLGSLGGADRPLSVSDSSPRRRRASLVDEIDRNGAAVKRNVRRETRLYQIAMRQVSPRAGWCAARFVSLFVFNLMAGVRIWVS